MPKPSASIRQAIKKFLKLGGRGVPHHLHTRTAEQFALELWFWLASERKLPSSQQGHIHIGRQTPVSSFENLSKKYPKRGWDQHTTLFHSSIDGQGVRCVPIIVDLAIHTLMEGLDQGDQG